jgi:hypothetical protein
MVKQYELLYEMWLFGSVVGCLHPHMNISFKLQNFNIFWSGNRIQKGRTKLPQKKKKLEAMWHISKVAPWGLEFIVVYLDIQTFEKED